MAGGDNGDNGDNGELAMGLPHGAPHRASNAADHDDEPTAACARGARRPAAGRRGAPGAALPRHGALDRVPPDSASPRPASYRPASYRPASPRPAPVVAARSVVDRYDAEPLE